MTQGAYYIVSETTEDRFGEADNLVDALRLARNLVQESQTGDPLLIEHDGRVVRQFVLTPEGIVEEVPVG